MWTALTLLLIGSVAAAPCEPTSGRGLGLEEVVSGFRKPVSVVAPPGDPRLFVVEQAGTIRIVRDGRVLPESFLDLRHYVTEAATEQGLYTVLFHPDGVRLYVSYAEREYGDLVLAEYRVDPAQPDRALPRERRLLTVPQETTFHQAGGLAWGPDGFLWMGIGDGGTPSNSPSPDPQDRSNLRGSMIRLDVEGTPYAVPPDNPWPATEGVRPEIAHYGLRNPWRFDFDPVAGALWIADTGHYHREEVDRVAAKDLGHNFGWSVREGTECRDDHPRCGESFTEPVWDYAAGDGCNAVIGGFVYRGSCLPDWQGAFFVSDYCNRWVKAVEWDGAKAVVTDVTKDLDPAGNRLKAVSGFGRDGAGELYLVDHVHGTVFRVVGR